MPSAHDNKRDHVLRGSLERVVADSIANKADIKQLVESILEELDDQNLIAYTPRSNVNLLTPQGRMLVTVFERPHLTVRELSVSLGVSTTAIIKAISLLSKDGLITRTKVSGRYQYRINLSNARYHPDLRRLIRTIHSALNITE